MITNQLLQILGQLAEIYPHWRFGQLAANMAGVADVSLDQVGDELLLRVASQHLAHRVKALEPAPVGSDAHTPRQELLNTLQECQRRSEQGRLGTVLIKAAEHAKTNVFDLEDEQLLEAIKKLIPLESGRDGHAHKRGVR